MPQNVIYDISLWYVQIFVFGLVVPASERAEPLSAAAGEPEFPAGALCCSGGPAQLRTVVLHLAHAGAVLCFSALFCSVQFSGVLRIGGGSI